MLIIFTNVLRYTVRDPAKEGFDGMPTMIFFIQTVLTMMHAVFIIFGEMMAPMGVIGQYPLLMSRVGRGSIMVLLGLPLLAANFFIWLCVVPILLIGVLNVWIGWNDPPVTMKIAREGRPEGTTSKEKEVHQ